MKLRVRRVRLNNQQHETTENVTGNETNADTEYRTQKPLHSVITKHCL